MQGKTKYFDKLSLPILFLVGISILLLVVHTGVQPQSASSEGFSLTGDWTQASSEPDVACLVLIDSGDENSAQAQKQVEPMLEGMSVGYTLVDVNDFETDMLGDYQTLLFTFTSLESLDQKMEGVLSWVEGGGGVMFLRAPEPSSTSADVAKALGIEAGDTYEAISSLEVSPDFMIGAKDKVFSISDSYASTLDVTLDSECKIHMSSTTDTKELPVLWERSFGEGTCVVGNFDTIQKSTRGIFASAYTLLEDVSIYPVINASCFFIDDFPSPVPQGYSEPIQRDYDVTTADFYTNIWWPDMLQLADKYGVKYSGMIIEQYNDDTKAPFESNASYSDYRYFGNMLLDAGGELGLHGYNHIPLFLDADFPDEYANYKNWESSDDIILGLQELIAFSETMYPNASIISYVPPSNLLSAEGRSVIANYFPQIGIIASLYFDSEQAEGLVYVQEFSVSDDGIIEVPRIASGLELTEFMELGTFSELNLHFVNSHFTHPDDALDEDRGADKGWETLKGSYTEYMEWLYSSAPSLRNTTVSEAANAVKQYDSLVVHRSFEAGVLQLELDGFNEEAYLLLRINEGELTEQISGGTLELVTGDLYLVHATQATMTIGIG